LIDFFKKIESKHIGTNFVLSEKIDNTTLIKVNEIIRNHPVEVVGKKLRSSMTAMKKIV
jgi:ketol-acid reductoisomerase